MAKTFFPSQKTFLDDKFTIFSMISENFWGFQYILKWFIFYGIHEKSEFSVYNALFEIYMNYYDSLESKPMNNDII